MDNFVELIYDKCPQSGFLLIKYLVRWLGKAISNKSILSIVYNHFQLIYSMLFGHNCWPVFGAHSKYFLDCDGSYHRRKKMVLTPTLELNIGYPILRVLSSIQLINKTQPSLRLKRLGMQTWSTYCTVWELLHAFLYSPHRWNDHMMVIIQK